MAEGEPGGPAEGSGDRVGLDRRAFVVSATFAIAALGGTRWLVAPAEAAPADVDAFQALSAFLTSASDLDPAIAARAFGQLTARDAGFPERTAALAEAVSSSLAPSVDDFLAHPGSSDGALRETMTTIVSAWYLGYTGTPVALRAEDDTAFVTFTGALMYRGTMDATVRPTYARAGLDYWVEPPPFVTPPPMPPGIASWGRESPPGVGTIPQNAAPPPEAPGTDPPPAAQQQE